MKFKKALVVILSLAMMVTLMPATAFATSTNTVAKVPTVASDEKMANETTISLEVKDTDGWATGIAQKIKLTLTNATWNENPASADGADIKDGTTSHAVVLSAAATQGSTSDALLASPSVTTAFTSASDNSLEFSFTPDKKLVKGAYITLTIKANALKSGTEDGAITVAIDGLDSNVTSSSLTVANVSTSTTTTAVTGTVKTFGRGNVTTSQIKTAIEIRETAVNSLKVGDTQIIKLTLPKGVTWTGTSTVSGDLLADSTGIVDNSSSTSLELTDLSGDNPTNVTYISSDKRTAWFKFKVGGSDTVRNVLTITPSINISNTASTGDINASLVGVYATGTSDTITDASDLLIAKYGDESVNVYTTDTVPTIYSGYTQDSNDKNFTFKITLDESMVDSLSAGRYVDFNLPEGVQISDKIKAKLNSGSNTTIDSGFITIGEDNTDNASYTGTKVTGKDNSSFSFLVPDDSNATGMGIGSWKTDGANKITFEVPVTVDAAYTGDITCNVTGSKAGLDKDYDIVVAKAESPITVATKTTEVKTGVQTQQTADITITENVAGYLNDDTDNALVLSIDTLGLTKGMVISSFDSAKVTAGDLELGTVKIKSLDKTDDVDYDGADVLVLPIKHSSTKVSTIEIKGVTVTLNRTLPEGGYNLDVAGSALITNGNFDNGDLVNKVVAAKDYVKIITPADSDTVATKIDATFVIGQASYTNNGTAVTMDAAPYIDSNSRTMVPIRYIAEACGVDNADITWNQATQTAKINGANTVVTVTMGSNIIQTSTGTITMDTTPVNSNGRIYVPLRFIANALNANVTWDGATKTITVTNGAN